MDRTTQWGIAIFVLLTLVLVIAEYAETPVPTGGLFSHIASAVTEAGAIMTTFAGAITSWRNATRAGSGTRTVAQAATETASGAALMAVGVAAHIAHHHWVRTH